MCEIKTHLNNGALKSCSKFLSDSEKSTLPWNCVTLIILFTCEKEGIVMLKKNSLLSLKKRIFKFLIYLQFDKNFTCQSH